MHLNVALCANTGGEDAVFTEDIQRTLEGYRKIRTMVVKGEPGDVGGETQDWDKDGKEVFPSTTFYPQTLKVAIINGTIQGWAHLNARWDTVDNSDGLAVRVARQGVGDEVVLHLPRRLGAGLDTVNGLTCWTLQTPILRKQAALQSN